MDAKRAAAAATAAVRKPSVTSPASGVRPAGSPSSAVALKASAQSPAHKPSPPASASDKARRPAGADDGADGTAADNLLMPKKAHLRKSSLPSIIGGVADLKEPVGASSSAVNADSRYEELDFQITQSTTFQDLWRIVRMVSAQTTFKQMTSILEEECRPFTNATSVRFLSVADDAFTKDRARFSLDEGIAGYVYHSRVIVNLKNPTEDKRYSAVVDADGAVPQAGALMCLPVVADSESDCKGPKVVIGIVIAVKARGLEPFTTRDCTAMYRLGEFAGNTLRNARQLDNANERYRESVKLQARGRALLDIARALGAENRLAPLVSLIAGRVVDLLDCDRCTFFFVDKEREELIVTRGASQGRKRTFLNWIFGQSNQAPELPFGKNNEIRLSMRRGIAGHVALTGETVNIRDAHQDLRFNPEMDKSTGYRTKTILCMPVREPSGGGLDQGDIIGVVQAINKNPRYDKFDVEDETLLATFSAQAAVAVKNSRLFERTLAAQKRSDALLEVTNALSKELKLGPLIRVVVAKVQDLLQAQRCTVFIVDDEKKELYTNDTMTFGMGAALPIDRDKSEMIRFPISRGIAGNVATTGKIINIADAYKDDRFDQQFDKKTGFRTKSILCMPVINHKNQIVGVIQVINKMEELGIFDSEDERMLQAFCSQASVAIENSRLFTQTERALNHALSDQRNLKFLLSVTKNLFSDMHLSSMIEQMTMQVHHLLKADNCALFLVDNDTKEYYLAKDDSDPTHKRYPFNIGIVGAVASSGRTIRISKDAFKDPRFSENVDQRKGYTTHSILCCPITAETQDATTVIGVISVRDEKDRGGFEREEENLLKVFCAQAAVAIINAKRFTKMLDSSDFKDRDHSAAQYLIQEHGMNLGSDDIDSFQFSMDEVKLLAPIGTGSYGEVYKAMVRGKVVAVKKLHVRNLKAEQVDAFCKEASLMCQLNHENVVQFIGAVTEPSNLCIITQYCARGSLADLLLDPSVEMDFVRKLKFACDAACGMLYLHGSNPIILHRDLKSDNLLVSADWTVKVADFGLTRFLSEKKAMTQVGTPMWMAPEIIMGKKYTEKADVYAFGIILWEVLTRLEPYEDKEPMQIVVEVVNENLRPTIPAEHLDNVLVPLMRDCWHADPAQRPTFKLIGDRLEEMLRIELNKLSPADRARYMPSTPVDKVAK